MRRFTSVGLVSSSHHIGGGSGAIIAAATANDQLATPPPHSPSSSAAATTSMTSCCAMQSARRHLKMAKSIFGFYLGRQGRRAYPFHRRPHMKNTASMNLSVPHFWSYATTKCQANFLPEENYITGDWTGKLFVSSRQVYTLQHSTSGAKCRMKRFPSVHEFNNPSRWNIGKELYSLSKPRMDLIDEQMLTKKQRLDYVKAGLLPK